MSKANWEYCFSISWIFFSNSPCREWHSSRICWHLTICFFSAGISKFTLRWRIWPESTTDENKRFSLLSSFPPLTEIDRILLIVRNNGFPILRRKHKWRERWREREKVVPSSVVRNTFQTCFYFLSPSLSKCRRFSARRNNPDLNGKTSLSDAEEREKGSDRPKRVKLWSADVRACREWLVGSSLEWPPLVRSNLSDNVVDRPANLSEGEISIERWRERTNERTNRRVWKDECRSLYRRWSSWISIWKGKWAKGKRQGV